LKPQGDADGAAAAALVVAFALMARQVAGKALRDALFLSSFAVTALPTMYVAAAAFSLLLAFASARSMTVVGPSRVVPPALLASAVLSLVEWALALWAPRVAAVAMYLHVAALGSVLISGFWTMLSERFDPRTARRRIGRIAAAGTLGGLAGAAVAHPLGAALGIPAVFPLLGLLDLVSAERLRALGRSDPLEQLAATPVPATPSGWRVLAQTPYLRTLATLVVTGAVTASLLDYVFKASAVASRPHGEALIGFFATFYAGVGFVTFLVQTVLTRPVLDYLGLGVAVGLLPATVAVGGVAAAAWAATSGATVLRGAEAILRNSVFRSGYELLYLPLPAGEKRRTKALVDVGFERVGDALGGILAALVITVAPAPSTTLLLAAAVALSVAATALCGRLERGYVRALERSLRTRAAELDLTDIADLTTRSAVETVLGPSRKTPLHNEAARASSPLDPTLARILDLKSGEPERVRRALAAPLEPSLVTYMIPLLAWDELAEDAIRALRGVATRATGQLLDALLDPDQEFAIRRRIPRALGDKAAPLAVQGLVLGLQDRRFEVRYQCGCALARIRDRDQAAAMDAAAVLEAILREVTADRSLWESQRLLDAAGEAAGSPFVDGFLGARAARSLQHVFTLLSLILEREPLRIAFRGLHARDEMLRGTALEYLENVLPPSVRAGLWPFLEDRRPSSRPSRPREAVLDDLLRSHESILADLRALQAEAAQPPRDEHAV
jgi:hypothetical protein